MMGPSALSSAIKPNFRVNIMCSLSFLWMNGADTPPSPLQPHVQRAHISCFTEGRAISGLLSSFLFDAALHYITRDAVVLEV